MLGDLVLLFGDTPARVDAIGDTQVYLTALKDGEDWYVGYHHIDPIPLTPEILEKNGTRRDDNERVTTFFDDGEHITHAVKKGDKIQILGRSIHYVHELQHALNFCGVKKEVVL